MKKLTQKQIAQIKELKPFTICNFHGNRKKLGYLTVIQVKDIVRKKRERELMRHNLKSQPLGPAQLTFKLFKESPIYKGTNYHKIMIEGNTGIYLAHPGYKHSDYNKTRLFDKNEKTLKLMHLYNKLVSK